MKKIIEKKSLIFLLTIGLLGFVFGIVFIFFIDKMDKLVIKTELTEYLKLISDNSYDVKNGIVNSSVQIIINYSLIFITSIIFILIPISIFINFYSLFTLGFLISTFIYSFGLKGFLYLIYLILPFKLLNILLTIFFLMFSFRISKKIYIYFKNDKDLNIKLIIKRYILIYFIFLTTSLIINVLEIYLSLFLLKL